MCGGHDIYLEDREPAEKEHYIRDGIELIENEKCDIVTSIMKEKHIVYSKFNTLQEVELYKFCVGYGEITIEEEMGV